MKYSDDLINPLLTELIGNMRRSIISQTGIPIENTRFVNMVLMAGILDLLSVEQDIKLKILFDFSIAQNRMEMEAALNKLPSGILLSQPPNILKIFQKIKNKG